MGRNRHRNRKQRKGEDQRTEKGSNERNYQMAEKRNPLFEKYYQAQGLMPEEEFESFLQTLRDPLPVTFRITGNRKQGRELLQVIQSHYLSHLVDATVDGQPIEQPSCLQWYPDGLAWQLNIGRKALRSNDVLKRLHEFLVAETESGNISRQEAVSMIPPILLDVKPHHKVLDLCAAPGSKTAQLIEYLHAEEGDSGSMPEGFVIANDVDNKRCYLMVHQVKRIQSPNWLIINQDATYFPNIRSGFDKSGRDQYIHYDRILVDVPCSGDGTMRKNPDVWTRWHPAMGYNMHHLQVKILRRALELLSVGGRLVYSTCSLNPIEDEAVLATMLQTCQGTVEIVDVQDQLPGLKKVKGLKTWKCMSKAGDWYESFQDVPDRLYSQVKATMFPPPPEVAEQLHLDRCVRVLPHHQNSGGFFIAALHKTAHLPWTRDARIAAEKAKNGPASPDAKSKTAGGSADAGAEPEVSKDTPKPGEAEAAVPMATPDAGDAGEGKEEGAAVVMETEGGEAEEERGVKRASKGPNPPSKQPRMRGYKEDPFLFLTPDDPVWPPIRSFYQLGEDFPVECMLYRSQESVKRCLYYVCRAICNIIEDNRDKLKLINTGVKIMSRGTSPLVPLCDYRITNEGIATVYRLFRHRKVFITRADAVTILSEENPFLDKLSPSTQQSLLALEPGSIILEYTPQEEDPSPKCKIVFCGWRGKNTVRSFVAKDARFHNLLLLGVDVEELRARVKAKKQEKAAQEAHHHDEDINEEDVEEDDADSKDKADDDDDSDGEEKAVGDESMQDADTDPVDLRVMEGDVKKRVTEGDVKKKGLGGEEIGAATDRAVADLKGVELPVSRTPEQNSPMDLSVKTE